MVFVMKYSEILFELRKKTHQENYYFAKLLLSRNKVFPSRNKLYVSRNQLYVSRNQLHVSRNKLYLSRNKQRLSIITKFGYGVSIMLK